MTWDAVQLHRRTAGASQRLSRVAATPGDIRYLAWGFGVNCSVWLWSRWIACFPSAWSKTTPMELDWRNSAACLGGRIELEVTADF